jgi:uncharacterized protein
MGERLQRPLVIGGLGLAGLLWLLELVNQTIGELGLYGILAAAIGGGVWWVQHQATQRQPQPQTMRPSHVDTSLVKQALANAEQVITRLHTETTESPLGRSEVISAQIAALQPQVPQFQQLVAQIATDLEREGLRFLVMGSKSSGKTTLIQRLQDDWLAQASQPVWLYEAPSFSIDNETDLSAEAIALKQSISADLVLYLVTGDLTASELRVIQQLAPRKRMLLVFNKSDCYLPEERQNLLSRMQTWVQELLPAADVVAIASQPQPLKVRQHQDNGSTQEWLEDQQPQLATLTQRLDQIICTERAQLMLASSFDQAIALKTEAAATLNQVRRMRALPLVEQFQWISAATAFASPLPTLDVVATAAINAQLILDLGAIYQQKFSLEQAQKSVTALGGLILKLGLVELSTRTVSSLLKTNAITYVAGGCIQAVSAAYLTRVVGMALIEYFHTQEPNLTLAEAKPLALERLSQILQQVFQQNQQVSLWQSLIQQVGDRLLPKPAATPLANQPLVTKDSSLSTLPVPSLPLSQISTPSGAAVPTGMQPSDPAENQLLGENGSGIPLRLPDRETITQSR